MKKLLCSAAVIGLAVVAANPAQAEDGLTLDVGGYFKGYGMYTDQDDEPVAAGVGESREFDIIRNTEVHFSGETTLDNGLTVGAHIESGADNEDGFAVNETYAYFSGGWGRVNFGSEDGASYLLQVEAPSADDNIDGIRQFVNPINYGGIETGGSLGGLNVAASGSAGGLDYDQDISGAADKLTYLSPIMNGFQVGVSYTPDINDASNENALNDDDDDDELGSVYEAAVRYEGQFNNIGVIAGAGYTHAELEEQIGAQAGGDAFSDDLTAWNAGLDLDIGPFGVGVAYTNNDFGDDPISATDELDEEETWVVGVDYTTGPFKLGASYLNQEGSNNIAGATGNDGIEVDRYTGGVVYTYGPGMTFRGSISHAEFENVAGITGGSTDADATSVVIGTQINF
ncbi:MAG: porin [Alphaproteobacteria bacterium PRO2]|nr:porin [Alphaproteobacteria bacterium PRO2]